MIETILTFIFAAMALCTFFYCCRLLIALVSTVYVVIRVYEFARTLTPEAAEELTKKLQSIKEGE